MLLTALALALASLCAPAQDPAPAQSGFRGLDFEGALEAARAEQRLVLVDFLAAGSPEAKVMDEVLWKDGDVRRWLGDNLVAIHADLKQCRELAARYAIDAPPAMLFVDGEGTEVERLLGARQPREFLQEARAALRCAPQIAKARKALLAQPADAQAHVELGGAWFQCQRFDKALDEYLWAWDRGPGDAEFQFVRRTALPVQLRNVLRALPSSRPAVVARRDAARDRLLKLAEGDDHVALALDVAALNAALDAPERQLELYRALRARPEVPREVVQAAFSEGCATLLLQRGEFAELLEGRGDVLAQMEQRYSEFAAQLAAEEKRNETGAKGERVARQRDQKRSMLLVASSQYVEALCAVGKEQDARGLVELTLLHDQRGQAYALLLAAAARGGRRELAREIADAGLAAVTEPGERQRIEKAVAANLREKK